MKFATAAAVLAFATTEVAAFPSFATEYAEAVARAQSGKRSTLLQDRKVIEKRVSFDPASQYVSTEGEHAFVPPNFEAGDVRGPCPGLNAAANHGYIPHNGVGTIGDFTAGTNAAFGMSLDLGLFLGVYGSVFDGNLLG
jgi:hypothetical protein